MTSYAQEVLKTKLEAMFPDETSRREIVSLLNQYGTETCEKEISRVQLGILKLSGTSAEAIKMWVGVGKNDYRDVLAAAEYPNELNAPTWKMKETESAKIRDSDRRQYEAWIKK